MVILTIHNISWLTITITVFCGLAVKHMFPVTLAAGNSYITQVSFSFSFAWSALKTKRFLS